MTLQLDTVAHACRLIGKQVKEHYRPLSIYFIVHHDGQRNEALGIAAQDIIHHPASASALHILQQPRLSEESCLMGVAVARENILFGLGWRNSFLALCTINIDECENLKQVKRQAYHLVWHAIDAYNYHNNLARQSDGRSDIIVRRRNILQIETANLQADVFSAMMCAMQDDRSAIKEIGKMRALDTLCAKSSHIPEHYPYVIAMESTDMRYNQFTKQNISKRQFIPSALRMAREIAKAFDEDQLKQWLEFSEPAQDMAWRGYSKEHILSAAINTSPSTESRALGHLVADVTKITPSSFLAIREDYSPYADEVSNEKIHDRIVEQIFEDIIAKDITLKAASDLLKIANQQNEDLTDGKVMGWCASALQAAATAYDENSVKPIELQSLMRERFHDEHNRTPWSSLKVLGQKIIGHQRDGEVVTLSKLSEIADEDRSLRHVKKSVQMTEKDPAYQRKLEAANELARRPETPAAQPKLAAAPRMTVNAPAPVAGPAGPGGMRGVGTASVRAHSTSTSVPPKKETKGDSGNGEARH